MYARQIAVMKGQAWNVVETLKESNHGPLELTRRARVCVWDDLVDIPVVVPMRVPSAEIRRRQEAGVRREEEEEMDISAARGVMPRQQNVLHHVTSVPGELPSSTRFDLASNKSGDEFPSLDSDAGNSASPLPVIGETSPFLGPTESGKRTDRIKMLPQPRSRPTSSRARLSYDEPRRIDTSIGRRKRNYSFSTRMVSNTAEEEDEGDLGYAAAAPELESTMKKVIVERIELVKSRNPVFTWC